MQMGDRLVARLPTESAYVDPFVGLYLYDRVHGLVV